MEETEKWLNRGYNLDREINALAEARKKAFDLACLSGGGGGEKVQSSQGNGKEKRLLELCQYDLTLKTRIKELYGILQEISDVISAVSSVPLRTLLIERYINYKTWEQIAESIDVSTRWIYKMRDKAIKEVRDLLDSSL